MAAARKASIYADYSTHRGTAPGGGNELTFSLSSAHQPSTKQLNDWLRGMSREFPKAERLVATFDGLVFRIADTGKSLAVGDIIAIFQALAQNQGWITRG